MDELGIAAKIGNYYMQTHVRNSISDVELDL